MVKIRLTRMGRHKLPYYRIVAVDSRTRRDGSYIEILGNYEPFSGKTNIKKEAIIKWLNNGAQPSETILSILKEDGLWKEYKDSKNLKNKKSKKRKLSAAKKEKKELKKTTPKKIKKNKISVDKISKDEKPNKVEEVAKEVPKIEEDKLE